MTKKNISSTKRNKPVKTQKRETVSSESVQVEPEVHSLEEKKYKMLRQRIIKKLMQKNHRQKYSRHPEEVSHLLDQNVIPL